ncbi:uncharacterized protein [Amphiura filiformis]|uniref:uncharacterized protein n=1 Tax=Amphiura filiformis TaxID=82378 RepID=UPI003B2207DB
MTPTGAVKPTGSSNAGDYEYELSAYHRRALVGGYVAAAILLLVVIVCGSYIFHIQRKKREENIRFHLSSFHSNGNPSDGSTDHHNAVFDASEDTVIGKADPI